MAHDQADPATGTRGSPWASAGIAVVPGLAVALAMWAVLGNPPAPPAVARLAVSIPDAHPLAMSPPPTLALSPDGRYLAYIAGPDGSLVVRALDSFETTALPGVARATYPFFSPDGERIGFFTNGQLRSIAVTGGTPVEVTAAEPLRGASWGIDGYIYFGLAGEAGLWRVSEGGGTPARLTSRTPAVDPLAHRWPFALPDGSGLISTVESSTDGGPGTTHLAILSFETREWRLTVAGSQARVLADRYLVYDAGGGVLNGAPFDLARQVVTGAPVVVLEGVARTADDAAIFALAGDGSLVYASDEAGPNQLRVVLNWAQELPRRLDR
jgi:hypothetical protein